MDKAELGRAKRAVKGCLAAVRERDRRRIAELLAPGSGIHRCYSIFGCAFLNRALNGMAGEAFRTLGVQEEEGGLVRVCIASPAGAGPATLWLSDQGGRFSIVDIFPMLVDAGGLPSEPPDSVARLYRGEASLEIDCLDHRVNPFLKSVYKHACQQFSDPGAQFQGRWTSLRSLTGYLRSRAALWRRFRRRGYGVTGFLLTPNHDVYFASGENLPGVVIKQTRSPTAIARRRLRREIAVLRALEDFPDGPKLVDSGAIGPYLHLATVAANGRTLLEVIPSDLLRRGRVRSLVMKNILTAASRLRARGVIHRDLAPDNIFVDDDAAVSLIDFGMASFLDRLGPVNARIANQKEIRNLGLILCCLLLRSPLPFFGSAGMFREEWRAALQGLRAGGLGESHIVVVRRALAADEECRDFAGESAWSSLEELSDAVDQLGPFP